VDLEVEGAIIAAQNQPQLITDRLTLDAYSGMVSCHQANLLVVNGHATVNRWHPSKYELK